MYVEEYLQEVPFDSEKKDDKSFTRERKKKYAELELATIVVFARSMHKIAFNQDQLGGEILRARNLHDRRVGCCERHDC